MLTTPFLTALDDRAAVKGARDPLGIQTLWTRLGRQVVGNLTTITDSVRDFTTLLLGVHFARQLAEELGPGSELASFLKWEQLAAYARASFNSDFGFRGTERVRRNLAEGPRVTLSGGRENQILGNQKIYGLWGLYLNPARASGLVTGETPRLTPQALEFVEREYLKGFEVGAAKNTRQILDALRPVAHRIDVTGKDKAMVAAVAKVLRQSRLSREEREFYRDHLLFGGPDDQTEGRQRRLADLLTATLDDEHFVWSATRVRDLAKRARSQGKDGHPLAHRLDRIQTAERVFAPAALLFVYLLGFDGKPVKTAAERLRTTWGKGLRSVDKIAFAELRDALAPGDGAAGDRWSGIASCLAGGDYEELIRLLVVQNIAVTATRGGASWIEIENNRFQVRFREERGALPSGREIPQLWRFPYFLDSLRSIAGAVREN